MKLFTAVLPEGDFRRALAESAAALRRISLRGTFTRTENIHLTVLFIGETSAAFDIMSAMDRLAFHPFDITLKGAGAFNRPDGFLCWAGLEESNALAELHTGLRTELAASGTEVPDKPFKPHITLARRAAFPRNSGIGDLAVRPASMTVHNLSLMKSEIISGKLTYTEIYSIRASF